MANLTGEYDVVVEAGVNMLNGILGAVHENQNTDFPTMPHSLDLVIDDRPRGAGDPVPESERTGIASRIEVQVSTPIVSLPIDTLTVHPDFGETVGVLARRSTPRPASIPSLSRLGTGVFDPVGGLDGIFVPPRPFALPRITAKVRVRAWVRDPTEERLPEFVDGDLFVTTALVRSEVAGVGTFLTLDRSSGPVVSFVPAVGTQVTDEQRLAVASIVRNFIRSDTDPQTFKVALPDEVKHFDFKLEPEAHRPSIMLLFTLTDRVPGPEAPDSVGAGLLPDGADFAIAVGRDFVVDVVRSQLFQNLSASYSFSKLGVSATVRPDLASMSFDLQPGRIVFSLRGDGTISWFGIDDHFTFSVRQAFTLQLIDGGIEPVADGDPVVDLDDVAVGGDYIQGKARDTIREERDSALAEGTATFRQAFDVRRQLEKILSAINPSPAGVTLTGVEIRPEGLLVPGTIALSATGPAVVTHALRGGFNDGLQSWIPGGTIDRFVWEQLPAGPLGGGTRVDEHRFVTEPMGVSIVRTLCLRIEGTRVTAGGGIVSVVNRACLRSSPVIGPVIDLSIEQRPLVPLTEEAPDGGVRVVGHYDPWAPGRVPAKGHAHLLLYFGTGADQAARLLREALGSRKRHGAVQTIAVLPPGGRRGARESEDYLLFEDPDGTWADAFGVSTVPAAVLIGPRGDVGWRDESAISAKKLAAALDKFAKEGGEIATTPIRLGIGTGALPPDVPLRLADGSELSMRRLRGRPVVLAFWTSRSEPSVDHLEFLRDLQTTRGRKAPLVIAVGDGERSDRVAEIARERSLPFLLADPDRRISRAFGVWCWPATVWIRPDLQIEAIDFGAAASPGAPPAPPSHPDYDST